MYVCISNTGNLRAGDIVILEKNSSFRDITASMLGGGIIGFVTDIQPEGCMSKSFVERNIGDRRVIGHAVILNGNIALISSESSVLGGERNSFGRGRSRVFR